MHWVLRISLAAIFIPHGISKYLFAGFLATPYWQLLGTVEVLGGLFIIVGAFGREILTRLAGLVFLVVMVGASIMVYVPQEFSAEPGAARYWIGPMSGFELEVMIAAVAVFFVVSGNRADT